jgi:hypothetical protein
LTIFSSNIKREPAMPESHEQLYAITSIDYTWLTHIIGALHGKQPSKWAVLCVCFNDDPATLPDLHPYRQLFTGEGAGTMNMVDFFYDMSHGTLDLSESQVFGWYRLAQDRERYVGNVYPQPDGKVNRNGLLQLARDAATTAGVNLAAFDGVVVSGYGSTDLCGWVGGMAALCDTNSLQPSLLGQEMGHGYGLDHARLDGSTGDYMDPWDIMSTAAWPDWEAANADYVKIGPGLNAWNMRSRGWLDEGRVWAGSGGGFEDAFVTLRPLHHHGLPGYLSAELGPYLVEFRLRERWDAAIPRSAILVHRFEGNRSYLLPAVGGGQDLGSGDRFAIGNPLFKYHDYYDVTVIDIDEAQKKATIRLTYRPREPFPHYETVGRLIGGVTVDGPGGIVIGNKYIPIPPRGPEFELVRNLGWYLTTEVEGAPEPGIAMRRQLLQQVVRQALILHAQLDVVSETPPGFKAHGANRSRPVK